MSLSQKSTMTILLSPLLGSLSRKLGGAGTQNLTPNKKVCAESKSWIGAGGEQWNRCLCLAKVSTVLAWVVKLFCCSAPSYMGNRVKCGLLKTMHRKWLVSMVLCWSCSVCSSMACMVTQKAPPVILQMTPNVEWPIQGTAALQSRSTLMFRHLGVLIQRFRPGATLWCSVAHMKGLATQQDNMKHSTAREPGSGSSYWSRAGAYCGLQAEPAAPCSVLPKPSACWAASKEWGLQSMDILIFYSVLVRSHLG